MGGGHPGRTAYAKAGRHWECWKPLTAASAGKSIWGAHYLEPQFCWEQGPRAEASLLGGQGNRGPRLPPSAEGVFHCSRPWETYLFTLGDSLQVASILEPNFNQLEETTFSLPPEVLSSLQSEDVALTRSLVEGCELEPQGPGRQLTWDPWHGATAVRTLHVPRRAAAAGRPRPCSPPG